MEYDSDAAAFCQVVVASHSWGDNVFRNFLVWITEDDPDWVEQHIYAYINIAGPVLGVAKSMTSLLSGAAAPLH
jgi:phospholipid:diacylglycerol acyltransferase